MTDAELWRTLVASLPGCPFSEQDTAWDSAEKLTAAVNALPHLVEPHCERHMLTDNEMAEVMAIWLLDQKKGREVYEAAIAKAKTYFVRPDA